MTTPGCRHGTPLLRYCPECEAESHDLHDAFLAGVKAGRWDEVGYELRDRRAQARTRAERARGMARDAPSEAIE